MNGEKEMTKGLIFVCKELGAVAAPTEIQIIPYGYHNTPKGDFLCDEVSAIEVINDFKGRKNDMVADYEHQTLLDGVEAPAAGWIKELVNKGKDGLWGVIEWTDKAKAYITNREYRYLSPVFLKRKDDNRVVRLINVALTNQPNIDGMVPLINKLHVLAGSNGQEKTKKEERGMEKVLGALGLKTGATEEEAVSAIEGLKGGATVIANKAVYDALGVKEGAGESEIVGTIMAMKQSHAGSSELAAKVVELEKKNRERDAGELVQLAMKEGKIAAAQFDWAKDYATKDPEGFKVFVAKATPVVPMGPTGTAGGGATAAGKPEMDDAQLMVNKALGISTEVFKKHNTEASA